MTRSLPLLALGWLLLGPLSAQADSIDTVIARNGRAILEKLQDAQFTTVGVLKGEIQSGGPKGPISLSEGKMGDLLATRLENVLVLAADPQKPIGIVRSPSLVAAQRDPKATFHTAEGRAALFAEAYPLAWGKESRKVSAFLVPRVTLDETAKTATVTIRYFDSGHPETWVDIPLENATTAITRQTMVDLDRPFVLPTAAIRKRGGDGELFDEFPAALDKAIQPIKTAVPEGARQPEKAKPDPVKPDPVKPTTKPEDDLNWVNDLLEFEVFYDDVKVQRLTPDRLPTPKPGQKVHFTLKTKERLGLVVLVNGINTADYDRASKESSSYVKWVLEKDTPYLIRGYYTDKQVYPFAVANNSDAKKLLAGLGDADRFGIIDLHIYLSVEAGIAEVRKGPAFRTREDVAESLEELQFRIKATLLQANQSAKKPFLVPAGLGEEKTLESTAFEGVLAAKLQIRYAD